MNDIQHLAIVVPIYNEELFLRASLENVIRFSPIHNITKEIILVDDCSSDTSAQICTNIISEFPTTSINYIRNEVNLGKGASVRKGITAAESDVITIHDADLEYTPDDLNLLLAQLIDKNQSVVFGSRFKNRSKPDKMKWRFYFGNLFLTWLFNIVHRTNLTDMETCYKMWRTQQFPNLTITENRFGLEPELSAKLAKGSNRNIAEVEISYHCRSKSNGKKIGWMDGIRAIYCILKYA